MSDGQSKTAEFKDKEGDYSYRMVSTLSGSSRTGGQVGRPQSLEDSSGGPKPRGDLEEDEHSIQGRPRPRISTPVQIDVLENRLRGAFEKGDPEESWEVAQDLIFFAREAVTEAARARFKANFGSDQCLTCEGLKAGPDVVATCAQVKQCYYTSIMRNPEKLSRVIETLA